MCCSGNSLSLLCRTCRDRHDENSDPKLSIKSCLEGVDHSEQCRKENEKYIKAQPPQEVEQ